MGIFFSRKKQPEVLSKKAIAQSKIQNVDIVKVKLKQARDKIKTFISKKQKDIVQVNQKIKQKLPKYQETGNKKLLLPFLKTKKDLQTMISNAEVRLQLVNQKLSQVELQQMDADTINVLDESNKYIKQMQNQLEKKDWRSVLEEAKNKTQVDWGQSQDIQEDQDFQAIWKELGGDKIPAKKTVHVDTQSLHNNKIQNQKTAQKQDQDQMALA